ncbi:MAG: tRNA lysidine(34) synthetase TilS [Elusimicrobia bacterium]|nr:tRNA lysidine(34) synthetase TilS [Elusimicrobiota bacterium]
MKNVSFWSGLWGKLRKHIRENSLIRPGDKILVGVSGGPDSVCLTHSLSLLQKKWGLKLHLLYIDHGLRKAASQEARFVRSLGKKLNLPVTIRKAPVSAYAHHTKRSLEDAGRNLRYRIFLREAKRLKFKKVATAHHLDDHVETVLLNLLRGTQAKGLGGIPVRRSLNPCAGKNEPGTFFTKKRARHFLHTREEGKNKVEVIRPLLCLRKAEILEYLRFWKLRYRVDGSNKDLKFTRNWVRLKLLPLLESKNPKIRENLHRLSQSALS